jgi:hypothetical protein
MYSNNKLIRDVADIAAQIMSGQQKVDEKLHPNQQKLDVHEPEKDELTSDDFKKLRAGKKNVKEETVEEAMQKADVPAYLRKQQGEKPLTMADVKAPRKDSISAKENLAKARNEEVEQIDEYKSTGGVYKHKGTYGTEKSIEAGYTDYDKENELAKKNLKDKPNRKKYGARQNFVRSTRVNESFSALLNVYKESGLKGLAEALVKEEPTNDQYKAELEDNKAKAEGKKKQPDLTKGYIQAVKQEETEIQVINADIANGVRFDTIEEREMTEPEMKKREEIVKSMKKGMTGFKDRYGERAKNVMYATATKQAMKD